MLATLPTTTHAEAIMWNGYSSDSDWHNASNWIPQTVPSPGDTVQIKDHHDNKLDIRTKIPGSYDLQIRSGQFNIHPCGKISSAPTTSLETGDFEGNDLSTSSITTISIEGTQHNPAELEVQHSIAIRYGHTDIHVGQHGIFSLVNGGSGGRVFRFYHSDHGTPIQGNIYIRSNGMFRNTGRTNIDVHGSGGFHLSEQASFLSNSAYNMAIGAEALHHTFSITGSEATIQIDKIEASVTNPSSNATFLFVADRKGISTVNTGTLSLNNGSKNAAVIIDASQLTGASHQLTLFNCDYITSNATFDSVKVIGENYRLKSIDYDANGGQSVIATITATGMPPADRVSIPEPSSYALILGLLALATQAIKRRR
jgi:hypothetical protein